MPKDKNTMRSYVLLDHRQKSKKILKQPASALVLAIMVMMFISMILVWQYQNFHDQVLLEQRQVKEMQTAIQSNLNEYQERGHKSLRKD